MHGQIAGGAIALFDTVFFLYKPSHLVRHGIALAGRELGSYPLCCRPQSRVLLLIRTRWWVNPLASVPLFVAAAPQGYR